MMSVQGSLPTISAICSRPKLPPSFPSPTTATPLVSSPMSPATHRQQSVCRVIGRRSVLRAMVQQAVPGAPAAYAKEMERLSAKESLLLAVSFFFLFLFNFLKRKGVMADQLVPCLLCFLLQSGFM